MSMYTDPKYNMVHTYRFPTGVDQYAATGIGGPASRTNLFRLPFRAKLVKFGIIPVTATYYGATSQPTFALKLENDSGGVSTELATFSWAKGDLTIWEATGRAPTTATSINANRVVMPCIIATNASAGTCMFFMDYQQAWDNDLNA